MRYLRLAFLAVIGLSLLIVALANRDAVMVRLLPADMGASLGLTQAVQMPLFVVIYLSIVAGLMIGFVWEWFREYRQRAAAAAGRRELERLKGEVTRLRGRDENPRDEVLALIDGPGAAR